MSNIEDEYKKWFKEEQIPNEDFDTEALWGDISGSLDEKTNTNSKTKYLSLLLFLLIGAGITGLYCKAKTNFTATTNLADKKEQAIESTAQASKETVAPSLESSNQKQEAETANRTASANPTASVNTNITNTTSESKNESKTERKNKTQNEDLLKSSFPQTATSQVLSESQKNPKTSRLTEIYIPTNTSPTSIKEKTHATSTKEPAAPAPTTTEINHSNNPSTLFANRPSFNLSPALPLRPLVLQAIEFDSTLPKLSFSKSQFSPSQKEDQLSWQLGLWGGLNQTRIQYQSKEASDLAKLKEETEKGLMGYSAGAAVSMVWKKRWFLNSGLEFHQQFIKFDYLEQKNINVQKDNHLLKAWINSTTKDTLKKAYGDTMIVALSNREVVHYNQYRKWSIPIAIGFEQGKGSFIYGLSAGAVLNFSAAQSGKILDENAEILVFDKNSAAAPFKSFDLGFRVSPILAYRFGERLAFTFSPQLNWQFHSNYAGTDIRMQAPLINLNAGMRYFFQ